MAKPVNFEIKAKYDDEPVERMMKRMKKKMKKERFFEKLRAKQFFEKPSIKRRRKVQQRLRTIAKVNAERQKGEVDNVGR